MSRLLLLVYCTEILCVLLLIPGSTFVAANLQNTASTDETSTEGPTVPVSPVKETSTTPIINPTSSLSFRSHTPSASPHHTTTTNPTTPLHTTNKAEEVFNIKGCVPVLMVTAGLILACTILLMSTVLLACKVCHLSRRVKALSSDADLISSSGYWMGTAKKNKSKTKEEDVKETTVLMSDLNQTLQEPSNGATIKDEGEKVKKEGEEKEEGDTAKSEGASGEPVATATENSSSSKPQEEVGSSQPTTTVAASSSSPSSPSEGTEEPKDAP